MKKSISLIATAVLATTLTGCSIGSDGARSEISKPGSEVTKPGSEITQAARKKKFYRQPPCHVGLHCPV